MAEAFVPGAGAAETVKRVGKVLGAWLLAVCFMNTFTKPSPPRPVARVPGNRGETNKRTKRERVSES